MKLLITGASGLLGSDVRHSAASRGMECVAVASSPRDGFIQADITTDEGIALIDGQEWDAMVHTAAWRNPEACDNDPEGALAINSHATGRLAALAAKRDAEFLYISTDYVFPGTNPPYAEDAEPNPVNIYGRTKLAGEHAALEAWPDTAILRIPALFGWRAGLQRCSLLTAALTALNSPVPKGVDDFIVRYPTCTEDVAGAIMTILESYSTGIHHFTASDKTSRYGIALTVAELLGVDASKVLRQDAAPAEAATRPKDSHLSMERLAKLGCPPPPPFRERMEQCLKGLGLIKR